MQQDMDQVSPEELDQLPAEDPNLATAPEDEDPLQHVGEPVDDELGVVDALAEDEGGGE